MRYNSNKFTFIHTSLLASSISPITLILLEQDTFNGIELRGNDVFFWGVVIDRIV